MNTFGHYDSEEQGLHLFPPLFKPKGNPRLIKPSKDSPMLVTTFISLI